ncbi:MAG TPA: type 1 glutamine amidotransferase [Xanthomonadaceae bacterium]|jgi:GMP synthase-like glutamine amidotransferase|nr:type 1 glutamine amidotransferase [Xanthomonadaceae bacterium]
MSERLTVVQHHPAEGVGEIGVWAMRNGIALGIYRADLGDLPNHDVGHCVLLGGPYGVNAPPDWLQTEKNWLRARIEHQTPVLGICLGSQLLAEALAGRVHGLDRPETGWTRIDFGDGGQLDALQWHEDAFTLPPGAESLARSTGCPQQMFRFGTHIGIQFHPEWNADLVAELNAHFGDASPLPRNADVERHNAVTNWFHPILDAWWNAGLTPPFQGGEEEH